MAKKKEEDVESVEFDTTAFIEKKYGKGVVNPGTYIITNRPKILSISPNFDQVCGGVPVGCLITLSSPSGFGKTTLALVIASVCQKDGRQVFYMDIENRLKPMNLEGIDGLDPSKVFVIRSNKENHLSGDDALQMATEILKNNTDICLIIDSASAICPESEITNDVSATIRNTGPKMFANFCRKNAGYITPRNNIVIVIKHVITNTSGYGATHIEDGGEKLKFQTDIRLMCTKTPELIMEGDNAVGHIIEWKVLKSATGQSNVTFKTHLRYGHGIDNVAEIIEIAQDYGLIVKSGAWYYLNNDTPEEKKFQGIVKLRDYLVEDKGAYTTLFDKVKEMSA